MESVFHLGIMFTSWSTALEQGRRGGAALTVCPFIYSPFFSLTFFLLYFWFLSNLNLPKKHGNGDDPRVCFSSCCVLSFFSPLFFLITSSFNFKWKQLVFFYCVATMMTDLCGTPLMPCRCRCVGVWGRGDPHGTTCDRQTGKKYLKFEPVAFCSPGAETTMFFQGKSVKSVIDQLELQELWQQQWHGSTRWEQKRSHTDSGAMRKNKWKKP